MKRIITALVLVFFAQAAMPQMDTLQAKRNAKTDADIMMAAFRTSDWNTFAGYTNEKLVKLIGGQEAYTRLLNTTMKDLFEVGKIDTVYVGNVLQMLQTPGGYQCVIESFLQMKVSEVLVTGVSYEIGTSANGVNWKFLRVDDDGLKFKPQDFIPDLAAELKVPTSQMVQGTLEEFLKTYELKYGPPEEEKIADPDEIMAEPPPPAKKPVKKPAKTPVKTKSKPKTKS